MRGEGSRRWYKVNLPIYISEEMVKGLVRESGKSERFVIDQILSEVSHQSRGQFGHGVVEEEWLHAYVEEDGGIAADSIGSEWGSIPSHAQTWAYPPHLRFGK